MSQETIQPITQFVYTNEDKIQMLRDLIDSVEDKYKYHQMTEKLLCMCLLQHGGEIKISPEIAELANTFPKGYEVGNGSIKLLRKKD